MQSEKFSRYYVCTYMYVCNIIKYIENTSLCIMLYNILMYLEINESRKFYKNFKDTIKKVFQKIYHLNFYSRKMIK